MTNLQKFFLAIIFAAIVGIAGCGGGGTDGTSSGGGGTPPPGGGTTSSPHTLGWAPPQSYTDGTPLNPVTDLDSFEVYVKESGSFTSADSPAAYVTAVDKSTGQVNTSFDLSNLSPFLDKGVPYYVSLRAVARNGDKSAFSSSALFSL